MWRRAIGAVAKSRLEDFEKETQPSNDRKVPPLTAAEAAKALGIKVYTICAGTKGYAPVPMQDPFGRKIYRNVKVDVDETSLIKIAEMTNAKFYTRRTRRR